MALATSSSSSYAPARRIILKSIAVYVAIVGVALLVVRVAGNGALPAWLAFGGAAAAIAIVTVTLLLPRLRHLGEATAAAESLAHGRFDARVSAGSDELAPLASALNTAAVRIERTVSVLSQERTQLEALLNASSDATVAIDTGARIVYANDAARGLFALAGGATLGRPFMEAVRDHDLNELVVAAAQRGERSVRVIAYGQAQRWLQATAVPIEGAGDWAALSIFHDLTEVRRLDSMRRDFISNVSHELRTPLAGIRAAAETLQEGALDDRPAAEEFLGHIQREIDRMTQLVEELLELSRIESGAAPLHFEQIDLVALADDTVRRFARQAERAGLKLVSGSTPGPVLVSGDGERLDRALGNLVANAIKFTAAGGTVTVTAAQSDDGVSLTVTDTGVGIEADQQARVFERFYKADRGRGSGGIGLGLAIVKHIVLAHGGSVAVESRAGRGSTFTIRLPLR